jgi:hypothetical protein
VVAAADTAVDTLAVAVVVDSEPAVDSAAGETADSVEVDPVVAEGTVQAALAVAGCSGTTELADLPIESDVSAADFVADKHVEPVVLDEKTEVFVVAVDYEEDNQLAAAAVAAVAAVAHTAAEEEQADEEEKYSASVLQVSQQVF